MQSITLLEGINQDPQKVAHGESEQESPKSPKNP